MRLNFTFKSVSEFYKLGALAILFFIFHLPSYGQQNIAPNATVNVQVSTTSPRGCVGPCPALNNSVIRNCGRQEAWIDMGSGPSTVVGGDFIEWTFPTVETFDSIIIHNGSSVSRALQGATVQFYDNTNSSWVTHDSFSGLPQGCVNRVGIKRLATNRVRLTLFQGTGNFSFREIEILEFTPTVNNSGIARVDSPTVFCDSINDIYVSIQNYGQNIIDSVDVIWEIDGVVQGTYKFVGSIDTLGGNSSVDTTVNIGTYNFQKPTEIKVYTDSPNGRTDPVNSNDTATVVVGPSLRGTYTVDSNLTNARNFKSMADMTAMLNKYGVCGPVVINIASGKWINDPIHLKDIPGTSANSSILISGDSSKTIITNDASVNYAALTLENTKHVHIQYIIFKTTTLLNSAVVNFVEDAHHDTLSNCLFWTNPTASNQNLNNLVFSGFAQGYGGSSSTAHDNVIRNNRIIGGGYGIRASRSHSSIPKRNNQFLNNEIDSIYYMGAEFNFEDSLKFIGNSINLLNSSRNYTRGINLYRANNFIFSSNYVWSKDYAVSMSNINPGPVYTKRAEVSNNMIYSSNNYGLAIYYMDSVDLWHNSINVKGKDPAIKIESRASRPPINGFDIRNNIFSADSSIAFRYTAGDSVLMKFDNNVFFNKDGNLMEVGGTPYADLTAYQTAQSPFNMASIQAYPQFISATDLHINGTIPNEVGDISLPINVDIDGDPRPRPGQSSVDIGADEFAPATCLAPLNIITSNPKPGPHSVTLHWDALNPAHDFQYVIVPHQENLSSGTVVTSNSDSVEVNGLNSNTLYDLYIRTLCGRGDTSIWEGPESFFTACNVPYFEDFETFDPNLYALLPWPKGWSSEHQPNNGQWQTINGPSHISPQVNTGTDRDHTKGDSSGVYVWINSRRYNATYSQPIDLTSPPIYIDSNQAAVSLSYWFFLNGRDVDKLEIVIDTNGVENTVRTLSGPYQSMKSDAWLQDSVALYGYEGQYIKIKFRGYTDKGSQGHLAIDDIEIKELPPLDVSVMGLGAPIADSSICYSSTEGLKVKLLNAGSDSIDFTQDSVDVNISVSGSAVHLFSQTINNNSINGGSPLASGQSISIPMGSIDMTNTGVYYFDATISMTNDAVFTNNFFNDTIDVIHSGGVISGIDTICKGDTTMLTVDGTYGGFQWQKRDGSNWLDLGDSSKVLMVSPTVTTSYRVLPCNDANGLSAIFTVEVINLTAQTALGDTAIVNCGGIGTAELALTKSYPSSKFLWYDAAVNGNQLLTGGEYYFSHDGDTIKYTDSVNVNASSFTTVWVEEMANRDKDAPTLLITEIVVGSVNAIEIQNVSNLPIDVSGWSLVLSDDPRNRSRINDTIQKLNGVWAPDQRQYWNDTIGSNYWGDTINWDERLPGWALLVDNNGNVVDFVAWQMQASEVSGISPLINNQVVKIEQGVDWNGDGILFRGISAGSGLSRVGNKDHNLSTDFIFATKTLGNQNNLLITPFEDGSCMSPRTKVNLGIACLVGLESTKAPEHFKLYPNPSNGLISLSVETENTVRYNLIILDAQGKLIYQKDMKVKGRYHDDIDLSHLAKGVYYIRLQSDQSSHVEKLIIQ